MREGVYDITNANPLDVVAIEYHIEEPNGQLDPLNQDNPADPSGRALYYNFSTSNETVIDGGAGYKGVTIVPNTFQKAFTQRDMDLRALAEPVFNVALNN